MRKAIDKLDAQIDMLQNEKFVEKTKTRTIKVPRKKHKVILEEATIEDNNLLSDLMGTNEETKVFAFDKNKDNANSDTKFFETISLGKVTINQGKVLDIYLPIFLILLIFLFIIFIIVI